MDKREIDNRKVLGLEVPKPKSDPKNVKGKK